MDNRGIANHITEGTSKAVAHYWQTRAAQRKKQEASGKADQGLRSAVTGGAQMDGVTVNCSAAIMIIIMNLAITLMSPLM